MAVLRDLRPRGVMAAVAGAVRAARGTRRTGARWLAARGWLVRGAGALALACAALAMGGTALGAQGAPTAPGGTAPWPVKTREHLDLWLHAFAVIDADTAPAVPLYRRGWRDRMQVAKNQARATTLLDTDRERLSAALAANPALQGAQFLPLSFRGAAEFNQALDWFLEAGGDPRRARGREAQEAVAAVRSAFPRPQDLEFARRLILAVRDEHQRFFRDWWAAEQRRRTAVLDAVDNLWHREVRPALTPYLRGSRYADGDLLLSVVLDGEGRTVTMSARRNLVTVGFPESPDDAAHAVYALAHELVATAAANAIEDNTTPAEKRAGLGELQSFAAVRGGHLLLQRMLPAMADGYARYYLRVAGRPADGDDPAAALAAAFPIPSLVLESVRGQIASALSGI